MPKPIAIIGSDIHFSLPTLALATAATLQMVDKSNELGVPLIIAGDLHDTKANMRAECVNAMIETFKRCDQKPYILVGNHDKINEKSTTHSLEFLSPYANIVASSLFLPRWKLVLIAYQHDISDFIRLLSEYSPSNVCVVHQGIIGANLGDYIQDKTALPKEAFAGRRVISGHYHARQDIQCPDGGLFSYVGNPYTLSFGEANDPEKGYQLLYADGSLQHCPTKLRQHRLINLLCTGMDALVQPSETYTENDLIWVKLTGSKEELLKYDRQRVAKELGLTGPFKLDLIPTDTKTEAPKSPILNQNDLLDSMIDSLTNTTDERKSRLKSTWKDLL